MLTFADDINEYQQFQENQARHYGFSNGRPAEVNESMRNVQEQRSRETQRRPVPTDGCSYSTEGAYDTRGHKPASGSRRTPFSPTRRQPPPSSSHKQPPTPSGRTHPPRSSSLTQPHPSSTRTQPATSNRMPRPDLNKPLPPLPNEVPRRNAPIKGDGKAHHQDLRAFAVLSGRPRCAESSGPSPGPPAKHQTSSSRPDSSSGWSFSSRKADKPEKPSQPSSRSSSRRSSFTESAKKAGEWMKSKGKIISMDKSERSSYIAGAKLNFEREVEQSHRTHPESRPQFQQEYLVQKQRSRQSSEALGPASPNYEAVMQHKVYVEKIRKAQEGVNEAKYQKAKAQAGSLDTDEHEDAQTVAGAEDPEAEFQGVGSGDRLAIQVSKLLDGIKSRPRKLSDDSDMDFGMTDQAPLEMMYVCGEFPGEHHGKGCGRPCYTFLKAGLCDNCYTYYKAKGRRVPSASPRRRGTPPKTPPDEASGTDLYMRLPGQHVLRKVRDTIYGDPGNPFAEEVQHPPPLPKNRSSGGSSTHYYSNEWPVSNHQRQQAPRPTTDMLSVMSDPFDLSDIADVISDYVPSRESLENERFVYSPAPVRTGTPTIVKDHWRPMSVDLGFFPVAEVASTQFTSPRRERRSGSLPTFLIQSPSATERRRDSAFYNFYDDILPEYGITLEPEVPNRF